MVTVRTYWAWETYCYVASARRRARRWAPRGRRGAGHIVSPRAQIVVKRFRAKNIEVK